MLDRGQDNRENIEVAQPGTCNDQSSLYNMAVGIYRPVHLLIVYAHIVNLTKKRQISNEGKCHSENILTNDYS